MSVFLEPRFEQLTTNYVNSAAHNDEVYRFLTKLTWSDPLLAAHRRHIEQHNLGFGDAAFHAMWLRLLDTAYRRFQSVRALEIGVFKGQVISLWSLIAKHYDLSVEVSAVTPLSGQPMPRTLLRAWLRNRLDRRYREAARNGNLYPVDDYAGAIRGLYADFDLPFGSVHLYEGYSTDSHILNQIKNIDFHIVYIDGDHSFDGVTHDLRVFAPKVVRGGWLIADDAGCSLPGTAFWKGHEAVSRAVEILPRTGFKNVLNVGHNRVYERLDS